MSCALCHHKIVEIVGFLALAVADLVSLKNHILSAVEMIVLFVISPRPLREQHPRQSNSRCCLHNFWNRVCLLTCTQTTPLSEQQEELFPSNVGIVVLLSQKGGGYLLSLPKQIDWFAHNSPQPTSCSLYGTHNNFSESRFRAIQF